MSFIQLGHDVPRQHTLQRPFSLRGIGLHSGVQATVQVQPAAADAGITFTRSDLPDRPTLAARPGSLHSSRLSTVLGAGGARVATVEHLLGALYGLGVDNARVVLDAEELPILDGSALPFVTAIRQAGVRELPNRRTFLRIRRAVEVRDGDRSIRVRPARGLTVSCAVDFDHPLVTAQRRQFVPRNGNFEQDIAPARTFGFLQDVAALRKAGLARGGSLQNAVVIDRFSVLNPGGLRFPDEFVRHKLLDILGDMALLGNPLLASVEAHKSGHELHHRLIRRLAALPDCCERVQLGPDGEAIELSRERPLPEPGLQSA